VVPQKAHCWVTGFRLCLRPQRQVAVRLPLCLATTPQQLASTYPHCQLPLALLSPPPGPRLDSEPSHHHSPPPTCMAPACEGDNARLALICGSSTLKVLRWMLHNSRELQDRQAERDTEWQADKAADSDTRRMRQGVSTKDCWRGVVEREALCLLHQACSKVDMLLLLCEGF